MATKSSTGIKSKPKGVGDTPPKTVWSKIQKKSTGFVTTSEPITKPEPEQKKIAKEVIESNKRSEEHLDDCERKVRLYLTILKESKPTLQNIVMAGINADFSRETFSRSIDEVLQIIWIKELEELRKPSKTINTN